mmetsp:Transcript_13505/g.38700  ORF Transcript_13505/g.38700 Transcript_13505/m.38700 type:complete len:112 (+) Transcript_13505:2-337(+)
MFRLIDLDEDGKVSAQEFVTGCMCLKGGAKTMDVAALLREVHKLSRAMDKSVAGLNARLDKMCTSFAANAAVAKKSHNAQNAQNTQSAQNASSAQRGQIVQPVQTVLYQSL